MMIERTERPTFTFDPRLESLRGLAALWVAFCHGFATYTLPAEGAGIGQKIVTFLTGLLTPAGPVIFFFVLSGYVVGQSFMRDANLGAYTIRRCFRLVPPFLASLLFAFAVLTIAAPVARTSEMSDLYSSVFARTFGLQDLWNNLLFRNTMLNGPTWSIYWEMVGSAILPFLVLLHLRIAPKWRWLLFLGVSTALAFSDFRYVIWFYVGFFAVGEFAALNVSKLFATVILTVGVALLCHFSQTVEYYKTATIIPSAIAAALIIGAVAAKRDFMTQLEWRPVRFLGRVSYSFYLLHWPIFFLCSLPIVSRPDLFGKGFTADVLIMVTSIAVALSLSALTYNWIERPSIALGRQIVGALSRLQIKRPDPSFKSTRP